MGYINFEFPHTHYHDDDLRELVKIVTQLVNEYNGVFEMYEKLTKEFEAIKSDFTTMSEEFKTMQSAFADMSAELNVFEISVREQLDNVRTSLAVVFENSKTYTDTKVAIATAEMRDELHDVATAIYSEINRLKNLIVSIETVVYSPVDGNYVSFATAISQLYYLANFTHGINNAQYAELNLTNAEYAGLLLTNNEYFAKGARLLHDNKIYAPTTGEKTDHANAIGLFVTGQLNTITNAFYAEKSLTNAEYEALNMTNYFYMASYA